MSQTRPPMSPKARTRAQARAAARLAAVQALYQMSMDPSARAPQVVVEFRAHRLGKEVDGELYADADGDFFADVVEGVTERFEEIDALIGPTLRDGWPLHRLEKLMASLLRAGVYELIARPDIPTPVIINEYVDVARAFYSDTEPRFLNGVLDSIGKQVRGGGG